VSVSPAANPWYYFCSGWDIFDGVFTRLMSMIHVNVASAPGTRSIHPHYRTRSRKDRLTDMTDTSADRQRVAGQLAGAVAHDLNNLLATILGCLELMERRSEDPERLKALIKRSSDAVDRAAGLTSRLAQFSRRQPQPRHLADVNALITDLMLLTVSALGKRVRVLAQLSPGPVFAQLDSAGFETTLLAICLAMRAAIPAVGQITIATQLSESFLTVSVTATGSGLGHLDLRLAQSAAEATGIVIQSRQVAERMEVILLLPPTSKAGGSEDRLLPAINPELHEDT
jgi:signal transduction histidine kinase